MDELDWAIRAGNLEEVLAWAEGARGIAARRHAVDRLEQALLLADPGSGQHGLLERARSLGVARSVLEACRAELPPHAVRVPLLATQGSSRRALVRAVMVAYDASPTPAVAWSLAPSAARAADAAIRLAARDASPVSPVDRFHLVPVQPAALEGVEIEGPSLGAAAYVSALALFAGRRVRASAALTGALASREVVRVDGVREKAAASAAFGLTTMILPAANDDVIASSELALVRVGDVDALAAAALEPGRPDLDVEAEVRAATRAVESGWHGYRWPAVREVVSRALARVPGRRPDLRIELLARLAGAERHVGRIDASLACIAEAEVIAKSPVARIAVPDEQLVRLWRQKAMTLLRAFRMGDAQRAAERSVAIARRARLRGELVLSLGAQGLCALARGAPAEAIAVFEEALEHTLEHRPSNAARSRAYLIEALGRAGRAEAAAEHYRLALREAEDDASRGLDGKVAWVRTSYAAALLAMGREAEVITTLSHATTLAAIAETPLPGLRARRYLGLARARRARTSARREDALALLETSPFSYDALEPALRTVAHVNVLHAQRERAARGEAPRHDRIAASLAELPRAPRVERQVRTVLGASASGAPERTARALGALLALVEDL